MRTNDEAICLAVLFFCFCFLPRHTNIMTDKRFTVIFLMNVLPDVYICSHRKKISPLLPDGAVKCTHNAQRMQTEINKSGTIVKKRI